MAGTHVTVDLVVVGTGSAAQGVTSACRKAGWSVTVVDYRPYGGTCAQRGCDPKKVLVGLSELADWSRRMQGKGVSAPPLSINWPDLMRFKRSFTQPVPVTTEQSFAAAGDAVASGGLPLTPVAELQGGVVAKNLLEGNRHTPDYRGIPSVVFTTPLLARVGLDEATARAQGLRFTTRHQDTDGWYSSRRVALAQSGFKVLLEHGTDRLLGAHLLGLHAEEVINLFALAIRSGLPASALREMVYAYPTSSSDVSSMV